MAAFSGEATAWTDGASANVGASCAWIRNGQISAHAKEHVTPASPIDIVKSEASELDKFAGWKRINRSKSRGF